MSDTVQIRVTNSVFGCSTCANTVERVLEKTAGVEEILIDDGSDQLTVGYDATRVEPKEIERIVEEWGFVPDGGG